MKICDVVKNSVWYDPRVRKQVISYLEAKDCEVEAVASKKMMERPHQKVRKISEACLG